MVHVHHHHHVAARRFELRVGLRAEDGLHVLDALGLHFLHEQIEHLLLDVHAEHGAARTDARYDALG